MRDKEWDMVEVDAIFTLSNEDVESYETGHDFLSKSVIENRENLDSSSVIAISFRDITVTCKSRFLISILEYMNENSHVEWALWYADNHVVDRLEQHYPSLKVLNDTLEIPYVKREVEMI